MCDGYHMCPICGERHDCDVTFGHDDQYNIGNCDDGLESFCNDCQENRWDDIINNLKEEGRL